MISGILLAESLRPGTSLDDVPLRVRRIHRERITTAVGSQPDCWTFLDFEADDSDADPLARALAERLESENGWYTDFRTATDTYVVFSGRVFRYPRGDAAGRGEATGYGRRVGVPEAQLDWPE